MNKKLWTRIALVAALCMALILACAVASADSSVIAGGNEPHEVSVGIGAADENVAASGTRLSRGTVLNLWCWYDGSGSYNMTNGKVLNNWTYTTYGGDRIKVTKGSAYVGLSGYTWSWSWYMRNNNVSAKVQKAQIKVTDRRGLVLTINLNFAPMPDMTFVSRNGVTTSLGFRKLKGIDGYWVKRGVFTDRYTWMYYGYEEDYSVIYKKLSKSKTTYVDVFPSGYYVDYCVVPYKKLGSKTRVSPARDIATVYPNDTVDFFLAEHYDD